MLKGLAHAAFTVTDMEAALHFYVDGLGLQHAFELHDERDRPWIHYLKIADRQFLELFYGAPVPSPSGSFGHLCLEVEDLAGYVQRLKEAGIAIDSEPVQGCDKNWQAWIHDPDGNRIELMQLDPDCPQLNC